MIYVIYSVASGRFYRTGGSGRWVDSAEKAKRYHKPCHARAAIKYHTGNHFVAGCEYRIVEYELEATGGTVRITA